MHPLHFGKKNQPKQKFDLTTGPSAAFAAKAAQTPELTGFGSGVIASVIPKGPRLNLEPVLDRIITTSPDAGSEEQGQVGGIHLPAQSVGTFHAYARVKVLAVAQSIKSVKVDDEIIVVKPQCQKAAFDGNEYFWTTEIAIVGIIRP